MRWWRCVVLVMAALLVLPIGSEAARQQKTFTFTWRPGFRYHQTPWQPTRLTDVTCPTTQLCAATDDSGNVLMTSHPREGMKAWTSHDVLGAGIYDIACPNSNLCMIPDGQDGIKISTNPFGASPSWRDLTFATGEQEIANLTCAGTSLCVVIRAPIEGGGLWVTTAPTGAPSGWRFVKPPDPEIFGIACPSPALCVAVTNDGKVEYSHTPAGPASSWKKFAIALGQPLLMAVSCPSSTFCAAVDDAGNVYTSSNPLKGTGSWHTADINGTAELDDIACPSANECLAADSSGNIFVSKTPGGGAAGWHTSALHAGESFGVHCVNAQFCLAFGSEGDLLNSSNPTGTRADWHSNRIDGFAYISAVSCGSPKMCIATGEDGLVLSSTNPTGGPAAWKAVRITAGLAHNWFAGASCSSANFCAIMGGAGDIFTSTSPTGPASGWHLYHVDGLSGGGYRMACALSICAAEQGKDVVSSATPLTGPWTDHTVSLESGELFLNDISCRSATFCAMVGDSFGAKPGEVATSTNPTGDQTQWTETPLTTQLSGVFCAHTSTLCLAVGIQGVIAVSTHPGGGVGAWTVLHKNKQFNLSGVACGLVCMAVGGGDVLTTSSTASLGSGSSWSHTTLPANLDRVSCAQSVCVATDNSGQIFAGTAH